MLLCKEENAHDLHAYGLKKAISGKLPCIVCMYLFRGGLANRICLFPNIIEQHRKIGEIAGGAKDTMYNGKKKHFSRQQLETANSRVHHYFFKYPNADLMSIRL